MCIMPADAAVIQFTLPKEVERHRPNDGDAPEGALTLQPRSESLRQQRKVGRQVGES